MTLSSAQAELPRSKKSRHALRHLQSIPRHIEPAPQDGDFAQGQLLRSICAALVAVGFDSVAPSALEAFRADVEEYILHALAAVRQFMLSARRTRPIAQDFIHALTCESLDLSTLVPHLSLRLPEQVTTPHISGPAPAETDPLPLAPILGSELTGTCLSYIPSHFLPLPSKHTWQATPVFTERETDPRKVRERAAQEGILAEQALRRLTSANRSSAHRRRRAEVSAQESERLWQETLADVLADTARSTGITDEIDPDDSVEVNHDRRHWRQPAAYRM